MTSSSWSWRRLSTTRTRSSRVSLPRTSSVASSMLKYWLTAGQSRPASSV
jgi:hypothetical protein